jgi:Na+/proline symporter
MSKRLALILSASAFGLFLLAIAGVVIVAIVWPPANRERFASTAGSFLGIICVLVPTPWMFWGALWLRDSKKRKEAEAAEEEEERPAKRKSKRKRDD